MLLAKNIKNKDFMITASVRKKKRPQKKKSNVNTILTDPTHWLLYLFVKWKEKKVNTTENTKR